LQRLSKDMIAGLHSTIKSHDETIFRLQSELRSKEEAHRRALRKMEKELEDARDTHTRGITRMELDFSLTLDQETKKYKLRVAELEHAQQYSVTSHQG
jgi:Skp family chaperone for outer membrane proteins